MCRMNRYYLVMGQIKGFKRKKAVTSESNCFIISGATRNRIFLFKVIICNTLISLEKSPNH